MCNGAGQGDGSDVYPDGGEAAGALQEASRRLHNSSKNEGRTVSGESDAISAY